MGSGYLHHHLPAPVAPAVGTVSGFGTQQLDAGFGVIRQAAPGKHRRGFCKNRLRHALSLGGGIDACQQEGHRALETIRPGTGHLVAVGGRQALRAKYPNPVLADFVQRYPGEIAGHVRQQIGPRITNLVH